MKLLKKLLFIINRAGVKSSWYFVLALVFGTLLESISISLIMPLVYVVAQREKIYRIKWVNMFVTQMGISSYQNLLAIILAVVVFVYLFKTLFLTFLVKQQNKYIFTLEAKVSEKLFKGYLGQPYSFHLLNNSSDLIKDIYLEVKQFANMLNQAFIFLTESLVLILLMGLLFYFKPDIMLIAVLFLGITSFIFMRLLREKVKYWGTDRKKYDTERVKILSDSLGNIKDIILYGRSSKFEKDYIEANRLSVDASMKHATFLKLPTVWLEFLAALCLVLLVGTLAFQGTQMTTILPLLSIFTAVAFRLLPSLNRMSSAYQTIRFYLPIVNIVYKEIKFVEGKLVSPLSKLPVHFSSIKLHDVSFKHENAAHYTLKNVSFVINKGEYIGISGDSGSGKSTIVDIILGLLKPTNGSVLVDDENIQISLRSWQNQIGYVAQVVNLTDDTIKNNIAFGIDDPHIDEYKLNQAIKAAQLEKFIASLPNGVETLVGEKGVRISGGQRQRIGIARALYNDPPVLVLDEATNSLDKNTELGIIRSVERLKNEKTIIMITHNTILLKSCDTVYRVASNGVEKI